MPEENKTPAAVPTGTPISGQPTATGTPAAAPASGSFQLPAELNGKSAAEVAQYYTNQYKDYDSFKSKAELADRFGSLKVTPEEIENTRKWISGVLGPLSQGKRAYFNQQTNQIEFVDADGKVTAAPAGQQPEDIFADWEALDGRTQAQRLDQNVQRTINAKAQELVQRYDKEIRDAMQRIEQRSNLFIDVLERWIDNPSLKPRDMLAKLNEYTSGGNPLDLVTRELSSPAEIKRQIEAGVAAGMAEFKNKWEQEHSAPTMAPASGMRPRSHVGNDGKPLSMSELQKKVIQGWRENGLTR